LFILSPQETNSPSPTSTTNANSKSGWLRQKKRCVLIKDYSHRLRWELKSLGFSAKCRPLTANHWNLRSKSIRGKIYIRGRMLLISKKSVKIGPICSRLTRSKSNFLWIKPHSWNMEKLSPSSKRRQQIFRMRTISFLDHLYFWKIVSLYLFLLNTRILMANLIG
jgi:hypothetical protein